MLQALIFIIFTERHHRSYSLIIFSILRTTGDIARLGIASVRRRTSSRSHGGHLGQKRKAIPSSEMRRKGFLPGLTPIRRKFSVSDESRVSEGGNFLLINNFHLATRKFPPRKTSKIERRRCVYESDLLRLLLWSELSLGKSACVLQMEQEISPLIPIAIRLLCHEFFTLTIRKWHTLVACLGKIKKIWERKKETYEEVETKFKSSSKLG